jgi:hypothetical protein
MTFALKDLAAENFSILAVDVGAHASGNGTQVHRE